MGYPEDVRIVESPNTSKWLRKVHIYLQGFWRALHSWKRIRLAEDLGLCVECRFPIKPLDFYFRSHRLGGGSVWHEACVENVLIKKATEMELAS